LTIVRFSVWRGAIVLPADERSAESFRGLLLRLRGRIHLTQRELAAQIGVHVHSIQGWEAGSNYPGVTSLRALIAAAARAGAFTAGQEADEAAALWAAAAREAPRLRAPFDRTWFDTIVPPGPGSKLGHGMPVVAVPTPSPVPTDDTRRVSWGQAPDVVGFVGRATERETLARWVLDERCRVVAVLGLGGIGKSLLATRLAHDLAPSFEYVFWRSLRDAPTPGEWLAEAFGYLAPGAVRESAGESGSLRRLLELLGEARCLLVLDNVDTVLQPGGPVGAYRPGYEHYGAFLRQVGESPHRSCLIMTSREEPSELRLLRGEHDPVRALDLGGLGVEDGRALLRDKHLDGEATAWRSLIHRYGGNGLALRVVGETIRELFGGSIAEYLEYVTEAPGAMVGGLRELLEAQMQRLSDTEHELLRRLAAEREPVGIAELAADLGPRIVRSATLQAAEGLRRRSLLERSDEGGLFGLQSVVLEFVTDQLIEDVSWELARGELSRVLRQPLMKAMAKEYVRRSQERLIAAPIVAQLVAASGGTRAAEQRLVSLLDQQRGRPVEDQGYGPGNIVNLLRLLRGDLKGVDLSGVAIRQAYLQDVAVHGANLAGSHLSETVLGEAFGYAMALALSADGAYVAAGTESGEVCWWRVADRTLLATLPGHAGGVRGLALSGDGRLAASGGHDGTVRLWDTAGGRPLATLLGHAGAVWGTALSEDGRLVASCGGDGTVRLWDSESGRALATLRGHVGEVWRVALSGDGQLVASGGVDGIVRLWSSESGRALATLRGHVGGICCVALSGDGQLVASAGTDGTVRLWDPESGRALATLRGHVGTVWQVALSRDGRLVASGGLDGTVRLWDSESGRALATLQGHVGGIFYVSLSGDGRLVASVSADGTVRLWEAASGQALAMLDGHAGSVRGVALSGDGRVVASVDSDGTVRLWDTESGRALATLRGHAGAAMGLALSGDGRLVASGGVDGTVRLWDTSNGALRRALRPERRYEGVDITGLSGITEAQRVALFALGAVERSDPTPRPPEA
jgi:WD40 repeat protein/transcriptional regulator with XRE-family HTH domain